MPERIYINRIAGSLRIHVELTDNEVADLLDDLPAPGPDAFASTRQLYALLVQASKDFGQAHRDLTDAPEVSR